MAKPKPAIHGSELKELMLSLSTKMDTLNSAMTDVDSRLNAKIDTLESSLSNIIHVVRQDVESQLSLLSASVDHRFVEAAATSERQCNEFASNLSKEMYTRIDECRAVHDFRLDNLERLSLEKELIISGVPVEHNDNPLGILGDICKALNCDLTQRDFMAVYRLRNNKTNGSNARSVQILVKVYDNWVKQALMSAYFKKGNLNLKDIGFQTAARIYINESLTKSNREIFNLASSAKKDNLIAKFFTRNGLIHVQRDVKVRPIIVHHINELEQMLPLSYEKSVDKHRRSNGHSAISSKQSSVTNASSFSTKSNGPNVEGGYNHTNSTGTSTNCSQGQTGLEVIDHANNNTVQQS